MDNRELEVGRRRPANRSFAVEEKNPQQKGCFCVAAFFRDVSTFVGLLNLDLSLVVFLLILLGFFCCIETCARIGLILVGLSFDCRIFYVSLHKFRHKSEKKFRKFYLCSFCFKLKLQVISKTFYIQ